MWFPLGFSAEIRSNWAVGECFKASFSTWSISSNVLKDAGETVGADGVRVAVGEIRGVELVVGVIELEGTGEVVGVAVGFSCWLLRVLVISLICS